MNDSGQRQAFSTGAQREPQGGRPRPDLISPFVMMRLGNWLAQGAAKYGDRNWEKGLPISSNDISHSRHYNKWKMGLTDEDHLIAALCNLMMAVHTEECIKLGILPEELDDMPHYMSEINVCNQGATND